MPAPSLAKLTVPMLPRSIRRPRLLALLDERSAQGVVWVAGPPGAGKTTSVADWLRARSRRAVWYTVDAGDEDPATLFYYLRSALPGKTSTLPLFTAEHAGDLRGFARRFLQAYYAALPENCVLVFDNHQDASGNAYTEICAEAIQQVPKSRALVIVSRHAPPPAFARFLVNESVSVVGWEALRLTEEEALRMAGEPGKLATHRFEQLYALSDGWCAGFRLLLERAGRSDMPGNAWTAGSTDLVFDYFASETLGDLGRSKARILAAASLLNELEAPTVALLTGTPRAERVLDELARRHLFVYVTPGRPRRYRLHSLFRRFLAGQLPSLHTRAELAALQARAATLAELGGDDVRGLELRADLGDWDAMERLLVSAAPRLVAQGRGKTLREFADRVPPARLAATPWLGYWRAMTQVQSAPAQAREALEGVHRVFESVGDIRGQLACVAAIVETFYFEYADFEPLDAWIARLEALLGEASRFTSLDEELRVMCAVMLAWFRRAVGPLVARCSPRIVALVDSEDVDPALRVVAGSLLITMGNGTGDFSALRSIERRVERLLSRPEVPVHAQLVYLIRLGFGLLQMGEDRDAQAALQSATTLAERHALQGYSSQSRYFSILVALAGGDRPTAQRHLDTLTEQSSLHTLVSRAYLHGARGLVLLDRGEPLAACEACRESVALASRWHFPFAEYSLRIPYAYALAAAGNPAAALQEIETGHAIMASRGYVAFLPELQLLEAHAALAAGSRERADRCLRVGLTGIHVRGRPPTYWFTRRLLPEMCTRALTSGVELSVLRGLVARYRLQPPGRLCPDWPWPVRILTLGQFAIETEGHLLERARKAQRKPLELLTALVCRGGTLSLGRAADLLWPEAEGDAALVSLKSTIHRLRKLLRHEVALNVAGAVVSLNPDICWIDVHAFEEASGAGTTNEDFQRAVALYRGRFLPDDESAQVVAHRERLADRFRGYCSRAGQWLEDQGQWEAALEIYLHARDVDPPSEAHARGAMRCYLGLGDPTRALDVYRAHCRLPPPAGMRPSALMESLAVRARKTLERPLAEG